MKTDIEVPEQNIRFDYPITAWCCFSTPPENIRKPLGFLMISGGIEKQHRAVMGKVQISFLIIFGIFESNCSL